jgi:hypothetical protein
MRKAASVHVRVEALAQQSVKRSVQRGEAWQRSYFVAPGPVSRFGVPQAAFHSVVNRKMVTCPSATSPVMRSILES